MKILAIRGKNLASLAGEFEVDFTDGPLGSAGIFAITGSTGSGKSTLLDALCLALFDSTPRMMKAREAKVEVVDVSGKKVAQNDSRSVLRRGTSGGYAEVEFVALTKEVYRSTWSVSRVGGKPGGSLRSVSMRLVNLTEGREEQGTKKELLARIVGLIGLSFEQFNRSVLLAQGDFALFLKAKQGDKAEILEKLTGTEVYSRISTAIFGKAKAAELDYRQLRERMEEVELLPEERLQELVLEKRQLAAGLDELKKSEETAKSALKWLEEERVLCQGKELAARELAAVEREKEEAAPRYAELAKLEQAQEVRDVFVSTHAALHRLADNRQAQEEKRLALRQADASAGELLCQKEQAQKELSSWKEGLAAMEPQLNEAKELDVLVAEMRKQWEEAGKECGKSALQLEELKKKRAGWEQTVKELHGKQLAVEEWFGRYRTYEKLVPAVELVTSLLSGWETAGQQKELNRKTLNDVRALAEVEQLRLEEMQKEAERLNHLQPAEVVLLRAQLREGEPCPVCGSMHHPAARLTEVQSLREAELDKARKRVSKEVERLTASVAGRALEQTRLATVIENYDRQEAEALAKVASYVSILPNWQELLEKGTLKAAVRRFGSQWEEHRQSESGIKEALAKYRAQLEGLGHEEETAAQQWQERRSRLAGLEKEMAAARSRRALLLDGCPTVEVVRRNQSRSQVLERQAEEAVKRHHDCCRALESVKGQVLQLEQEQARLQALSEEGRKQIDGWLSHCQGMGGYDGLQRLLAKDAGQVAEEKRTLDILKERFTAARVLLVERTAKWEEHGRLSQRPSPEDTEKVLQARLSGLGSAAEQHSTRLTQIEIVLDGQEKNRCALAGFEKELKEKEAVNENWGKLNELFGSQNGFKFKEIAQGYTLDVLLLYANRHLEDLAPRYELQRVPETLALQIVDLDMMGEVRSVHSLSGGESFLLSLALALGLSSLSSNRMNVESLFIDEGFGSLDVETLRVAMDALERLQMQGRKIGVISHVAEMTERIAAQIRIVKDGNGKSRVEVAGG